MFHIILSIYLLIFIGLLVAAEFKREKPRLYFSYLDNQFGRSLFITFTQLLILETSKAQEIILSIVVFAISLLGMCLGYGLPNDGINSGKPIEATATAATKQSKNDREPAGPPTTQLSAQQTALDLKQMAANAVAQLAASRVAEMANGAIDKFRQGGGSTQQEDDNNGKRVINLEDFEEQIDQQQQQYQYQHQPQQQPMGIQPQQQIQYQNNEQFTESQVVEPQMVEIQLNDDDGYKPNAELNYYRR